ncbi:hypothetical protein CZ771_07285 [Actinomycetales bacterium JB111]|nr:hypothetical protein CZ771_07285 [Actinomycetales bacterium JB111]
MEVRDTLGMLLRRWYVVLLGLALTAGLAVATHRLVPTPYEAGGSILLMPAETVVDDDVGNPYLYLGGMADALDVLVVRARADESRGPLLEGVDGADLSIEKDPTTPTPIVNVRAESSAPGTTLELRDAAMAEVVDILGQMQDELDITGQARIRPVDLTVDESATAVTGTATKLAVAALGAGLLATFILTGVVDGWLTRRAARREREEPEAREPVAEGPADDEAPDEDEAPTNALPDEASDDQTSYDKDSPDDETSEAAPPDDDSPDDDTDKPSATADREALELETTAPR